MSFASPLRRAAAALLIALVASGCSSNRRPWMDGGVEVGTITVDPSGAGERWTYRDVSERVVRVEHRDADGGLDPAHPIRVQQHDSSGRMTRLAYEDATGLAVIGPDGFALRESRWAFDEEGHRTVEHDHFGVDAAPLVLPAGYFREVFTFDGGRLLHRRFYDVADERVAIEVGDWDDVSEIRYKGLRGATPIVMEMLIGPDGKPLHKQQISGHTELRIDSVFHNYRYGDTTVPVYAGTIVTYSSPK